MKLFRITTLIVLCLIGVNQTYAQCEISVDTTSYRTQSNVAHKKQKPTRYDRIWAKYSFMAKPVDSLTEQQKEMRYKVGDILNSKTTIEKGRTITTITRKDLRQAGLPAELYYMMMKNIEMEDKFLATFSDKEAREVEEGFLKLKEKYWVESKAYWQNRKNKGK